MNVPQLFNKIMINVQICSKNGTPGYIKTMNFYEGALKLLKTIKKPI